MKVQSQFLSIRKKPSNSSASKRSASVDTWTVRRALAELKRYEKRRNVLGMARFGIKAKKIWGVSKPQMDQIARKIGKNHELGLKLWNTGIHDARLLGMLISQPKQVTPAQMESWVRDFDNWDVCDGTCCHLFVDAAPAWNKTFLWTARTGEYQKRAGFALAAFLAIHDKAAPDAPFRKVLKLIERQASDNRNFVRKAVNWALRNIGKRNSNLNRHAIATAERIRRAGFPSGRWIASDALRELQSKSVQTRLRSRGR